VTALVMQYTRRQVSIAADTAIAVGPKGASRCEGLAAKIFIAPHLAMAMCGTGSMWALVRLGDWLQFEPHVGGFDAVEGKLPAAMEALADEFAVLSGKTDSFSAAFGGTDAFLFGWSEALDGFAMRVISMRETGHRILGGLPGVWANPHLGKKPDQWPALRQPSDFLAIVKRQQESELANPPATRALIGGPVLLLDMWKGRMEFKRIGELPIPGDAP